LLATLTTNTTFPVYSHKLCSLSESKTLNELSRRSEQEKAFAVKKKASISKECFILRYYTTGAIAYTEERKTEMRTTSST
jgi:predicted amidophosphoribosyltransferase